MSDFSMDLNSLYGTQTSAKVASNTTNKKAGESLEMEDFLKRMVAQFQNQSMDDTADTSEMMNQMVQMSVIQAVSNLTTLITNTSNMSYSASLVGKEVTIGQYEGSKLNKVVGTVTGTGTMNGAQVLFLDNDETAYQLTDILAVGRVPEKTDAENAQEQTEQTLIDAADGALG